jgi:tetratricopeptide (TPR) repeat protein
MKSLIALISLTCLPIICFSQSKHDSLLIDSLNQEAWSLIREDPLQCLKKAKRVYRLAKNRDYSYGSMKAMISCGSSLYLQGELDSAEYYYKKALQIASESNIIEGKISIHTNLGSLYRSRGMYKIALEHIEVSLELKKGSGYCKIVNGYANLGNLYVAMGEYRKAVQVFKEGKKYVARDTCSSHSAIPIGLGVAYYKLGETDLALKEMSGTVSRVHMPKILNNRGLCYMKDKNYQKALDFFEQALIHNRDSINSRMGMVTNYLNIAKIYTYLQEFTNAEENLSRAWDIIKVENYISEKIDYYENFSDLSFEQGRFKQAYDYLVEAEKLKDSIQSKELDELQSGYYSYFNVQNKERQLEEEKLRSEALELNNEKERIKTSRALWIVLLVSILAVGITYFLYRAYKKNRLISKQKDQLAEQKNQLNEEVERRKYFQERYNETLGRTLQASNSRSKREDIDLKRIVMVEKVKGSDAIEIHTLNGAVYTKVKPIKKLIVEDLSDSFFTLVNKSVIMNLHYIKSVELKEDRITIELPILDRDKKKSVISNRSISLHKQGEIRESFLVEYEDFVRSGGSK